MMSLYLKNRKANVFAEYIIIFGVVAMLFVAMNTYVKRSYQGRLKDMTDYFVGTEQAVTQDSEMHTKGETKIEQEGQVVKRGLGEGRTIMDVADNTKTNIMSITLVPEESNYNGRFVDADRAQVPVVPPGDQEADKDQISQQLAEKRREVYQNKINQLTIERDQKLALANAKRNQAASLDAEAVNCYVQINDLKEKLNKPFLSHKERERIRQEIAALRQRAIAAKAEAVQLRKDAVPLEREAAVLQAEINALQSEINQAG